MTEAEYNAFYDALVGAELAEVHDFEKKLVFEGCLAVEILASRGRQTLAFGPLKPVGLADPHTGKMPYACLLYTSFCHVRGQKSAKRALEIAAAGGHNVLMIGPPGSGKTLMARCLPTILPDMTFQEALEVTRIHSVACLLYTSRCV